jgi:hypothetical protein
VGGRDEINIMAAAKGNNYVSKRIINPQHTESSIDALCESILDYAENERNAHFAAWARRQGKVPSWIIELAKDHPKFMKAYEDAKTIMAAKLVNGSIYNDDPKFNPVQAMAYMPVYNLEYRELLKFKASLAKEEESQRNITINLMDYSKKDVKDSKDNK